MTYGSMALPSRILGRDIAADLVTERREWVLRLTMLRGEALRLPRAAKRLRVLSGTAWLSFGQEDFLLARGETLALRSGARHAAVISALGDEALSFAID